MSDRQRRELGAFACYCARRIEHELGLVERWKVSLSAGPGAELACVVRTTRGGQTLEASGLGRDPVLAVWDAMCRLEQRLREQPLERVA